MDCEQCGLRVKVYLHLRRTQKSRIFAIVSARTRINSRLGIYVIPKKRRSRKSASGAKSGHCFWVKAERGSLLNCWKVSPHNLVTQVAIKQSGIRKQFTVCSKNEANLLKERLGSVCNYRESDHFFLYFLYCQSNIFVQFFQYFLFTCSGALSNQMSEG